MILLVFSALVLAPSAPAPADTKQCDAKPFTLKKPVQTAAANPAPAPKPPKPAPKPKPKPIVIGCKQTDAKPVR
jgi:hypothetical protein